MTPRLDRFSQPLPHESEPGEDEVEREQDRGDDKCREDREQPEQDEQ